MKIKPLFDRVVIKQREGSDQTAGGIVLPSGAQEKPQLGMVVAVGDGTTTEGTKGEMFVQKGDQVLYSKYSGAEYKIDGQTLTLLKQTDILAIVEE